LAASLQRPVLGGARDLPINPSPQSGREPVDIRPPQRPNATEVRTAIQSALERHADREAASLDVRMTDGDVDVRGVVHTLMEKNAVLGAARGTRGVQNVADHVRVRPLD
jgi:osmotically-inducible protein OsmY